MSEKKAQAIGIVSLGNMPMDGAPRQAGGLQESAVILRCRGGEGQSADGQWPAVVAVSPDWISSCIQRVNCRAKAKQIKAETMVTTVITPQTWP